MLLSLKLPFLKCVIQLFLLPCIPLNLLVLIRCFHENEIFKNYSNGLTHWRPIPIHYRDQSFLHCRPISIVYRDQFYIFFLFGTIPDTVSGLGFSVCYLLLSFHSKFCSGGVHSFYFTKPLRNPTLLDKLLLTISKMAEDTPKAREFQSRFRSRKWREWLQWDIRHKWSPVWAWEIWGWLWYRSRSRW